MASVSQTLRDSQTKVEQEYDALVTKLNRCQGQLGSKQAQAQKLSPPEYQKWLIDKKQEHADITVQLQAKKQVRAEARRKFNSWAPQVKEEWLEWPDEEGWWWNYTDDELTIHHFEYNHVDEVYSFSDADLASELEGGAQWAEYWKFQEEPEVP